MKLEINKQYKRDEIPKYFGLEFNQGSWCNGHVCPKDITDQILFVTVKKSDLYVYNHGESTGREHYEDKINTKTVQWSSQASTTEDSKKGSGIINHEKNGSKIHLFVRETKLNSLGKASAFKYLGTVKYTSHTGEKPMNIRFKLENQ